LKKNRSPRIYHPKANKSRPKTNLIGFHLRPLWERWLIKKLKMVQTQKRSSSARYRRDASARLATLLCKEPTLGVSFVLSNTEEPSPGVWIKQKRTVPECLSGRDVHGTCTEDARYMHGTCTEDARREHAPHSVDVAKIDDPVLYYRVLKTI